jgi:hypothetical protein
MSPFKAFLLSFSTICVLAANLGCAPRPYNIPAEIMPYAVSFELITGVEVQYTVGYAKKLQIIRNGRAEYPIAICRKYADGYKEVIISMDWWVNASHLAREQTLWHEFAHCSLNAAHNDLQTREGPASIMNTYHMYEETYILNRNRYIDELKLLARMAYGRL